MTIAEITIRQKFSYPFLFGNVLGHPWPRNVPRKEIKMLLFRTANNSFPGFLLIFTRKRRNLPKQRDNEIPRTRALETYLRVFSAAKKQREADATASFWRLVTSASRSHYHMWPIKRIIQNQCRLRVSNEPLEWVCVLLCINEPTVYSTFSILFVRFLLPTTINEKKPSMEKLEKKFEKNAVLLLDFFLEEV